MRSEVRCPGFKEARVRTLDYSLLAVRSASIRGLAFSGTEGVAGLCLHLRAYNFKFG